MKLTDAEIAELKRLDDEWRPTSDWEDLAHLSPPSRHYLDTVTASLPLLLAEVRSHRAGENSATATDPLMTEAMGAAIREAREEGRREGIEEAARVVNARKQSIAVARDRAKAAGRDGVAEFRDSEVVTLDAVEAEVRSLASRVIPGGGRP